MAKSFLSDKLVDIVKLRSMMPDHQNTFSDGDILDILNQEMDTAIIPRVLDVNEEYLLYYEDQDYTAGTTQYAIPYRAIANKLREVQLVDSAGKVYELTRVEVDDMPDYQDSFTSARHNIFYLKNNFVVIPNTLSISTTDASVRMYFFLRPGELVPNNEGGVITAIDTVTGVVTLSTFPTDFSTATYFDFIGARSPHRILSYDVAPTSVNSTALTVTFPAASLPTGLAVGDYVCIAQETIVPQLVSDLHTLLAQRAALVCIEAVGDEKEVVIVRKKLDEMEKNLFGLLDNRVVGAPQKVNPRNSILRQTKFNFFR